MLNLINRKNSDVRVNLSLIDVQINHDLPLLSEKNYANVMSIKTNYTCYRS